MIYKEDTNWLNETSYQLLCKDILEKLQQLQDDEKVTVYTNAKEAFVLLKTIKELNNNITLKNQQHRVVNVRKYIVIFNNKKEYNLIPMYDDDIDSCNIVKNSKIDYMDVDICKYHDIKSYEDKKQNGKLLFYSISKGR